MTFKQIVSVLVFGLLYTALAMAQLPEDINTENGSDEAPVDGVTKKHIVEERRVLPYEEVREADIFWEKRVWRVIDTRVKMNKPFAYPERMLFTIIKENVLSGEITGYSVEDDKFTAPITIEDLQADMSSIDTVITIDPETYDEIQEIVQNDINDADVKRFRIKEIWFFEEELSVMKVRILGIAPIIDEYDENGNFLYERPLFWIYYPHLRDVLAREDVYTEGNDAARLSWDNIFEMRFFASYIWKESNVLDARLEDLYSGVDRMMESDKIKMEIFNFEHDLWSF